MKFHISKTSRSVSLRADKEQQKLVENIFKIPLLGTGLLQDEFVGACGLMALGRFDVNKCRDYSRSGSKSCIRCPFRTSLRTVKNSLEKGVMSA